MGSELEPFARSLLGTTVTGLWQLAAVSTEGTIPLPGELVLQTDAGFVALSYGQNGLLIRPPVRRGEIRWGTEPELVMGDRGNAEEWLGLTVLDDQSHVPELPMFVAAVTGWFGVGYYLDAYALILSGRDRSMVLMTTNDFDLRCATRQEARQRGALVAATTGFRFVEQERRH